LVALGKAEDATRVLAVLSRADPAMSPPGALFPQMPR
jgi:hypothetical protein